MNVYLADPLAFPVEHPNGFPTLEGEPVFDAAKHLQIEMPQTVISLKEFGYSDEDIAQCPCDFGITNVFRILSDEGAECMLKVARLLEPYVKSNARISRNVRGGAYQSKFLRDLCHSKELTETVSKFAGLTYCLILSHINLVI